MRALTGMLEGRRAIGERCCDTVAFVEVVEVMPASECRGSTYSVAVPANALGLG